MDKFIELLIKRSEELIKKTEEEFGKLNSEQLNKKPAPDKWSIGQVFDHLIVYNKTYFPIYEEVATGKHKNSFWQNINPLSHLTGRLLLKALRSEKLKVKALKSFEPSLSKIPDTIIKDFIGNTDTLLKYFKKIGDDNVNISKTIVRSPANKIITYTLKDSMDISMTHMERHLKQAERVLGSS